MTLLFIKSIVSIALVPLALVALWSMLALTGRLEPSKYPADALKRIHKLNGIIYLLVFIYLTVQCMRYVAGVHADLSARGSLHTAIALAIGAMILVKMLFVRYYKKYYNNAKGLGIAIVISSLVLFGMSGGYYLLATGMGHDERPLVNTRQDAPQTIPQGICAKTDPESIANGKILFEAKCSFCHETDSEQKIVGPGLKGILKRNTLPASGLPAVPENIRRQIISPYKTMPSFSYLSPAEIDRLIAYLNTL